MPCPDAWSGYGDIRFAGMHNVCIISVQSDGAGNEIAVEISAYLTVITGACGELRWGAFPWGQIRASFGFCARGDATTILFQERFQPPGQSGVSLDHRFQRSG